MTRPFFVYHDSFLEHTPPAGHPERPDRLASLIHHLKGSSLWKSLAHVNPVSASDEDLLAVHSRRHIDLVRETSGKEIRLIDEGDTFSGRTSFDVAVRAAGAVITAVDSVVQEKSIPAFCAVRPPGHHAERDRPMGFCLFNNVAVGARYAQKKHGIEKILVLDWDVHHGNGTQEIFYDDASVFYISVHQYPFYPGTGAESEQGEGKGMGYTLNLPLPAGTGEDAYMRLMNDTILPELARFKPDLLFISSGFDAHKDDPLGGMNLDEDSFSAMTTLLKGDVPIVSVLEGGYNLEALCGSVEAHLRALSKD